MGKKSKNRGDCTQGMSDKDRKRLFAGIKEIAKSCRLIGSRKFDLQNSQKNNFIGKSSRDAGCTGCTRCTK
jgi:hypothetical protein